MKSWIVIGDFDGEKFAARYGLDAVNGDFSMNGNVLTVIPDHLVTDDPPIFEPPDPPGPTEKELLEQRLTKIEADIVDLKASPI